MSVPNNALKTLTFMTEIQILWATVIGLPILAVCITLAMPSVRQDSKQN